MRPDALRARARAAQCAAGETAVEVRRESLRLINPLQDNGYLSASAASKPTRKRRSARRRQPRVALDGAARARGRGVDFRPRRGRRAASRARLRRDRGRRPSRGVRGRLDARGQPPRGGALPMRPNLHVGRRFRFLGRRARRGAQAVRQRPRPDAPPRPSRAPRGGDSRVRVPRARAAPPRPRGDPHGRRPRRGTLGARVRPRRRRAAPPPRHANPRREERRPAPHRVHRSRRRPRARARADGDRPPKPRRGAHGALRAAAPSAAAAAAAAAAPEDGGAATSAALLVAGFGAPVPALLSAGDVLLMDSRAVHRGSANGERGERRTLLYVTLQVPENAPPGSTYSLLPEYRGRLRLRTLDRWGAPSDATVT